MNNYNIFKNILDAIRGTIMKSRPAYKDYVGTETVTVTKDLASGVLNSEGEEPIHECLLTVRPDAQIMIPGDTYTLLIDGDSYDLEAYAADDMSVVSYPQKLSSADLIAEFDDILVVTIVLRDGGMLAGAYCTSNYLGKNVSLSQTKTETIARYDIKKLPEECLPDSLNKRFASVSSAIAASERELSNQINEVWDSVDTAQTEADTANKNLKTHVNDAEKHIGVKDQNLLARSIGMALDLSGLPSKHFNAVAYGAGKYVVVGDSGIGAYSYDGVSWHAFEMPAILLSSGKERVNWYDITYGAGKFVAAYDFGHAISSDGLNWRTITSNSRSTGKPTVTYANIGPLADQLDDTDSGVFLMTYKDHTYSTSANLYDIANEDLLMHSEMSMGQDVTDNLYIGDCIYVAVTDTGLYRLTYSNDWKWDYVHCHMSSSIRPTKLGFVNSSSGAVALGYTEALDAVVSVGKADTEITESTATNISITSGNSCVTSSGTQIVIFAETAADSKEFVAWHSVGNSVSEFESISLPCTFTTLPTVCYHDGVFMAIGDGKAIYSVDDGETWSISLERLMDSNGNDVSEEVENILKKKRTYPVTMPDWLENETSASDYVKNRPGGYYVTESQKIWSGTLNFATERTAGGYSVDAGMGYVSTPESKKCNVVFNGTKYENVDIEEGSAYLTLGDSNLVKYPFYLNSVGYAGGGTYYFESWSSVQGKVAIEVYADVASVVKIPQKFLEAPDTLRSDYLSFYGKNICFYGTDNALSADIDQDQDVVRFYRDVYMSNNVLHMNKLEISRDGIVLPSSDNQSGRKFRLTVGSDGQLGAEEVLPEKALLFSAPQTFSIRADIDILNISGGSKWASGDVEYSKDGVYWSRWNWANATQTDKITSGYDNRIWIRYTKDSSYSKPHVHITIEGENVSCSGDLSDVIPMSFRGNTGLIAAPSISDSGLTRATMEQQFMGCTNLLVIPKLSGIPLAGAATDAGVWRDTGNNNLYASMFSGCTALKFSAEQTDECPNAYRIPCDDSKKVTLPASRQTSEFLGDMFTNTSGTVTGTPSFNVTYYTNAKVV